MPISKNEKVSVLKKLCENLLKLEPQELPTLAFQLFTLSTIPTQLMIPLISLNQYFQKYLYQKQLDSTPESESLNFDSIGKPDKSNELTRFLLTKRFFLFGFLQSVLMITTCWQLKIQFSTILAIALNIKSAKKN